MELAQVEERLAVIEAELAGRPFVLFHTFERDGRKLNVALTELLRKNARKQRVWRAKELCATLKNASYGFDEARARSVGGRDGIFSAGSRASPTQ